MYKPFTPFKFLILQLCLRFSLPMQLNLRVMFKARMGMKEPHPLQKHWVLLRLRMAQSEQGRQRLKTALRFYKVGAIPPPLSAKIRSRCWSRQIFGATAVGFLVVSTIHSIASAANMAPSCQESGLMRGLSIPASSSLPSLVPLSASHSSSFPSPGSPWCFYFFFFCFFFFYFFFSPLQLFFLLMQLAFSIGLLKPLHCTLYIVLFFCLNKR